MTIGEFFGTLQEGVTAEWRKHLQTNKYSEHMALDEFYKEMPEKIDALIEAWQADNGIVRDYKNILTGDMGALEYVEALKQHVIEGRGEYFEGKTELESLADDVLSLIDSTIYKLKHLKESLKSLTDFLNESLNEAMADWSKIVGEIQAVIDGSTGPKKDRWGNNMILFGTSLDLVALQKAIKKNKPTPIKRNDEDNKSAWVGFSVRGKDVEEIVFSDGATSVQLHAGNAIAVEHRNGSFGAGFLWANAPGTRNYSYECPTETAKAIYDIVKTKY